MIGVFQTAEIAIAAGVPKVLLQLQAGLGLRVKVLRWSVSFDGVSGLGKPILVEFERQDNAGASSTAPLAVNLDDSLSEVFRSSCGQNFTTIPGQTAVLDTLRCKAQGRASVLYAYGQEPGVKQQKKVGIRITSSVAVNGRALIVFEE